MKKGLGPLIAIVVIGALVVEAVILTNFIVQTQFLQRTARETEIIRAVNTLEFTKKSLQQAFKYSVIQTISDAEKSGSSSSDIKNSVSEIFNNYCEKLKSKNILIPTYAVSVNKQDDSTIFTATSIGYLTYQSDFFEINSKTSFSVVRDKTGLITQVPDQPSIPADQSSTTSTCECKLQRDIDKCSADCPKVGIPCSNVQDCM